MSLADEEIWFNNKIIAKNLSWHDVTVTMNGKPIIIKEISNYKPKTTMKKKAKKLSALEILQNKSEEMRKEYDQVISDLKKSISEFSKENGELQGRVNILKECNTQLEVHLCDSKAKHDAEYERRLKCDANFEILQQSYEKLKEKVIDVIESDEEMVEKNDKQVSINLLVLCKDNGIVSPSSMTIRETKKVEFVLRNIFQEVKGHGE